MKHGLLMLTLVAGLTASAWATTIISQNFDDTGVFTPSVTTAGDASNTGGLWTTMTADPGDGTLSGIRTAHAHSATQSLLVQRGSTLPFGTVNNGIDTAATTSFEFQYWVYRANNTDGSAVIQLDNSATILSAPNQRFGIFIQGTSGYIMQYSSGTWANAGLANIPVNTWTRIRMEVDMTQGDYGAYNLYLMFEGQIESGPVTHTLTAAGPSYINAVRFNPQGTAGGQICFDDISLTAIPEPATMSLLAAGSLLAILRKRSL